MARDRPSPYGNRLASAVTNRAYELRPRKHTICSLCSPEHKRSTHRQARLQSAPTGTAADTHTGRRGCKPRLREPAAEAHTGKRGYKPRLREPAASVL